MAELQDMATSRSIYLVSIDVEGQEGVSGGVNSISVAIYAVPDRRFLSGGHSHAGGEGPVDLSDIMKRHRVDAHVFVCTIRQQRSNSGSFPWVTSTR